MPNIRCGYLISQSKVSGNVLEMSFKKKKKSQHSPNLEGLRGGRVNQKMSISLTLWKNYVIKMSPGREFNAD